MPVRKFVEPARVRCAVGACALKEAVSFIALAQLQNTTVGSFVSGAKSTGSGGGSFYDFQVEVSQLEIYKGAPSRGLTTTGLANVWCVFAATKVSGTAKAKLYIYRFDTKTWQIGEGAGEIANPTEAAEEIRLGQWNSTENFQGLYAASAMYNKVLTQAEIEELATASSLQSWLKKGPVGMWMFNQPSTAESVLDITGNGANQTELVGTTVEGVEPPIPYFTGVIPLQSSAGVASATATLSAKTAIPLVPITGTSNPSLKLRATTSVPLAAAAGVATTSLSLRVRRVLKRLRINEKPPMRQYLLATAPGGRTYRWGEDELLPDKAIEDLSDSDAVPGGYKELSGSLARKPSVDYADMQRGTRIELFGAGQMKLGEYRLQQAPQTAGDKIVMDPAAVGYQAHLADDESARAIPLDADMSGWVEPSTAKKVAYPTNSYNTNAEVSLAPAGDPTTGAVPALVHEWKHLQTRPGSEDVAESDYNAEGIELGQVMLDFLSVTGMGGNWRQWVWANSSDTSYTSQLKSFASASATNVSLPVPAGRSFLSIQTYYPETYEGADGQWQVQYKNIRIQDRAGIPIYGTWPNVGVLASDVIAYALGKWAPMIDFTTGGRGTLQPTGFPIPHLVFKEPTTVQEMINQANRFELNEWAIWDGQDGPTFYLNPRGEREGRKRWRARVRPAQLKETGPSMDRVFNGVLVQYQDVDGTTRIVGPPGSGYKLTDSKLVDADPLNPANQIPGLRRWTKIAMNNVATKLGAVETGVRFLEQTKLLDGSGEATLNGYVEDDHGMFWPYYCVRSGDLIEFVDSSIPGDRYIVSAQRSRSSRSVTISLDAPPDSMEALLERLGVELVARGLGS